MKDEAYTLSNPFDAIADELTRRGFKAESQQTGGNVYCILVESASALYGFGTADTTWAADVYANRDAYDAGDDPKGAVNTSLPSDVTDPTIAADAILAAIRTAEATEHPTASEQAAHIADNPPDEIPDMPHWFRTYLAQLPEAQRRELCNWINTEGGGDAVLDVLTEATA